MPRIPLNTGAYAAASLTAAAQRCICLYPETIPPITGEPTPTVHLLTPGLRRVAQLSTSNPVRALYRATSGSLYVVVGSALLLLVPTLAADGSMASLTSMPLGTLTPGTMPVSMTDNGVQLLVVDGTSKGLSVDLISQITTPVVSPGFYGGDRVDVIESQFVLNRPHTRQIYLSDVDATTFDPLYITNGTRDDMMITLAVVGGNLWTFGANSTSIWQYTGAPDFPLQQNPDAVIEYGCAARYSLGRADRAVFWLSRTRNGQGIVLKGSGYGAIRISTHAIEVAIAGYGDISDAIGMTRQRGGHTFYILSFPGADVTWVYDLATEHWHEWPWFDGAGGEHRHRANCMAFVFGQTIVGDWQDGRLYALDDAVFTDDGAPIRRLRSWPHATYEGHRLKHEQFVANVEVGTIPATGADQPPMALLRWSDDAGHSWGNAVPQSLGATGQTLTCLQWRRLGISRSRVYELSWDAQCRTSLLDANVTTEPCST